MKRFVLTALVGIVALNSFLGYSGNALSQEMRREAVHDGVELSVLSEGAFRLQPLFYLVALAALAVSSLGFLHRLSENALAYAVVSFLALDIIGLLISLWGFSNIHFLLQGA
jgi:hypothetical protein